MAQTRTNIELNENTYVGMYLQGQQYASTQWDGNQLKCTGEIFRIDDIDVTNGISYEDDEWLIQETTVITDGETMKGEKQEHTEYSITNQNLKNAITTKKLTVG